MEITSSALIEFLDRKFAQYNQPAFIEYDPISIPHRFTKKEDVEIAAFLVSSIAWGNRKGIISSGMRLMHLMDNQPADFVRNFSEADLGRFRRFVHRTFQPVDLEYFLFALKNIYLHHGGMEKVFTGSRPAGLQSGGCHNLGFVHDEPQGDVKACILRFRDVFFSLPHPLRTRKHLSDPSAGSAAKRVNMFLRWMVRNDGAGVDFGLWTGISAAELMCPLDVHSARVARRLGLLSRKQNDWKAVVELTANLRRLDPADPVKYDYALFGLGAFDKQ